MKPKFKKALELFLYFFRIGWFTFGGGWSIVAQVQKDYAEKKQAITSQELLDIVSVGRSLPGTMIGNVSYLFGYNQGGAICGIASVLGVATPPVIILSLVTLGYAAFRDNIYVARALMGVRAVVAPVILSAVLKLHKGAFPHWEYFVLCGVAIILSGVFKISSVLLVLGGVVAGLLLNMNKKEEDLK